MARWSDRQIDGWIDWTGLADLNVTFCPDRWIGS